MATPAFVADFFPTATALLHQHAPSAWAERFGYSEQHCPPPVAELPGVSTIHNPTLLPLALLGACVGFYAASLSSSPKLVVWRRAFLCFAGMNLSAVACHSLLPPGTGLHAFARAMDVACTGASSVCLMLASFWRDLPARELQRRSAASTQWLLAGAAVCMLGNCLPTGRWPLVNELAYGATAVAAAAVLAVREMGRPGLSSAQRFWVVTAGAAAAVGLQGGHTDAVLCKFAGAWFSSTHLLFLCCGVAVFALGHYVAAAAAQASKPKHANAVPTPQRQQPPRRAKEAAVAAIAGM